MGPPRRPRPARTRVAGILTGRPAERAAGYLPRPRRGRAHGAQPVAGPGDRSGPPRVVPPLDRVRDHLADRGARCSRSRAGRWATARRGREAVDLALGYPYVLWAVAALRAVHDGRSHVDGRRRGAGSRYETWYWLHVYTYLAIALAFLHQLFVGADFTRDPVATALLGRPVRRDGAPGARVPVRPAAHDLCATRLPGRWRRARDAGRGLAVRDGAGFGGQPSGCIFLPSCRRGPGV